MKKKLTLLALTATLSLGLLAGCGGAQDNSSAAASGAAPAKDDKTITIGASAVPHAEILKSLSGEFEKKGYQLDVVEFTDFVRPNKALADGELDANFFQHKPYLDNFNEENKTDLVPVGYVNFIPMEVYPGKTKTFDGLKEGAKVAVPNDASNEARALLLLADNGLITLKDGVGIQATIRDIVDNPRNLEFVEIEAAQIPRMLNDVDIAVINGNYFISAGLNIKDALTGETTDSLAAKAYANLIAVRPADKDSDKAKVLAEVLNSPAAKNFTNDKYKGGVIPVENADVEAYWQNVK